MSYFEVRVKKIFLFESACVFWLRYEYCWYAWPFWFVHSHILVFHIIIKNFIFLFFPCAFFNGGGGRKWFTPIRESIHSLLECSKSQIVICQLWIIIQGWNILFMMHESSVPLIQRKCCHTSWQFKATGNRSKLHKVCRIHTLVDRYTCRRSAIRTRGANRAIHPSVVDAMEFEAQALCTCIYL